MNKKISLMLLICALFTSSCGAKSSLKEYDYKDAKLLEKNEIIELKNEVDNYYKENKSLLEKEDYKFSTITYIDLNFKNVFEVTEERTISFDYETSVTKNESYSQVAEQNGQNPRKTVYYYEIEEGNVYICNNENYSFVPLTQTVTGSFNVNKRYNYFIFEAFDLFAQQLPNGYSLNFFYSSYGNFKIEITSDTGDVYNKCIYIYKDFRFVYGEIISKRKSGNNQNSTQKTYITCNYDDNTFTKPSI